MDCDPPSPLQVNERRINDSGCYYQVLNHLLLQEDVLTYTAERKKLTPQLHSEGTAACSHILLLYNKTARYKLCIKNRWLYYSPSFSYITPDLEEVKMPAEAKQKELQELLYLIHFHYKFCLSEQGWNIYLILQQMSKMNWALFFANCDGSWRISPYYHSAILAVSKNKHSADKHKYTPRLFMLQRIGIRDEESYSEVHIKGRSQTCQEKDARAVQNQFIFLLDWSIFHIFIIVNWNIFHGKFLL